jgi:CubicO group peptidase (beta-lactamase class C family)
MIIASRAPVSLVIVLIMMMVASPAIRVSAQRLPSDKITTLAAFIDTTVPQIMAERHIVGTAVTIVHDGRVLLSRGFGRPNVDTESAINSAIDPARTLFRVGSVTKVFTAVAALQLAQAGHLDLHKDIRAYVPDVQLRHGPTTHQLLTHTAGFDERFAGAATESPQDLQALSDHLRHYTPPQLFQPGRAYSYSNYNYALAGLVVERVSGARYDQYMADNVFTPLGMTATTAQQPPPAFMRDVVARGYRWDNGRHEPVPYSFTQVAPAGSITTTAADVGRLMLMLLNEGAVDGAQLLRPEFVAKMLAPQYAADARIPGTSYGFRQVVSRGHLVWYAGGTLGDHAAAIFVMPAEDLGICVISNALPGAGDYLFEPLMTHLAGSPVSASPVRPAADAAQRATRVVGTYQTYRRAGHEMSAFRMLMPMMQSSVTVESDGAIRWQGRRWIEIAPLVFRHADSDAHIAFRENEGGDVIELHADGGTYERIPWWKQTLFHVTILAICLITFMVYAFARGVGALRRRPVSPRGRLARACALMVALLNLAFVVGLVLLGRDLGRTTPLPLSVVSWLLLPLISAVLTVCLVVIAAKAWRQPWGTRRERVGYASVAICGIAFLAFLHYWRLLGIRY